MVGSDEKKTRGSASARLFAARLSVSAGLGQSAQAWTLESRTERSALGAASRRWLDFSMSKNLTLSHKQMTRAPSPQLRSHVYIIWT